MEPITGKEDTKAQKARMQELISTLDRASRAYYMEGQEIMSNFAFDRLYDELLGLEERTGIVLPGSPTQKVGYETVSSLPKERHPSRMLSLDKTKDRNLLQTWLGNHTGLLSWKLDGLTIVLTYREGRLVKAVTRGNGDIGEVVTANARTFINLPVRIPYKGTLVLRGEAVISYEDFRAINENLPEDEEHYKNPRNLCAGSVRQLDSRITAGRKVRLYPFTLVSAEDIDFAGSRNKQMAWMKSQGFDTVFYRMVDGHNLLETVQAFEEEVTNNPIPSDGLVLTFDDILYSESLGETARFPRDAIAFKWTDQTALSRLREVEWSASRTGLINPVAIFDPVELEGTTVSRASVHNISIMEGLALGKGDQIEVYKANMIIPQLARNLTSSGTCVPPSACPVCGGKTEIHENGGVKTLHCSNPACPAKGIKGFVHFVSRDAMNITGLSEMTIEKFVARGFVKEEADFFRLDRYREELEGMEGFGAKSFRNLIQSVEKARHTSPNRLLYALGIPGIGPATAKRIADSGKNNVRRLMGLSEEDLQAIEGIGEVLAASYVAFFRDADKRRRVEDLVGELVIDESSEQKDTFLAGQTFVITGSLRTYQNRKELASLIERAGGKVAGSVSRLTSYLINNDKTSVSGKNKTAQALGIPIIDEETISAWLKEGRKA